MHADKRRQRQLQKIARMVQGQDIRAIPALVSLLKDKDPQIRAAAASALGQIGDCVVVPDVAALLNDADRQVRWSAAHALGWLQDERSVAALAEAIFDLDDDVSQVAMMSLQWLNDPSAVPSLVKLLPSENRLIREFALGCMVHFEAASLRPLLDTLVSGDRGMRRAAADALVHLGEIAVPGLLDMIGHADGDLREVAVRALIQIGDPAVDGLLATLRESRDENQRLAARSALIRMGTLAVRGLAEMLLLSDQVAREDIIWALTAAREISIPYLIEALRGADQDLREATLEVFRRIGDPVVSPLIDALFEDNLNLRLSAAWLLGGLAVGDAMFALLRSLQDETALVRWAAARALGEIGDSSAVPGLIKALEDPDSGVRVEAAQALGRIGAAGILIAAFRHSREEVRWAATIGFAAVPGEAVNAALSVWRDAHDVREAIAVSLSKAIKQALVPDLQPALVGELNRILHAEQTIPSTPSVRLADLAS